MCESRSWSPGYSGDGWESRFHLLEGVSGHLELPATVPSLSLGAKLRHAHRTSLDLAPTVAMSPAASAAWISWVPCRRLRGAAHKGRA